MMALPHAPPLEGWGEAYSLLNAFTGFATAAFIV